MSHQQRAARVHMSLRELSRSRKPVSGADPNAERPLVCCAGQVWVTTHNDLSAVSPFCVKVEDNGLHQRRHR